MKEIKRDGDGYLLDMSDWSLENAAEMVAADEFPMNKEKWGLVLRAREYFDDFGTVPPIRKFAKYVCKDKKYLFNLFLCGPMKPITKYGGLPKPTGCV